MMTAPFNTQIELTYLISKDKAPSTKGWFARLIDFLLSEEETPKYSGVFKMWFNEIIGTDIHAGDVIMLDSGQSLLVSAKSQYSLICITLAPLYETIIDDIGNYKGMGVVVIESGRSRVLSMSTRQKR